MVLKSFNKKEERDSLGNSIRRKGKWISTIKYKKNFYNSDNEPMKGSAGYNQLSLISKSLLSLLTKNNFNDKVRIARSFLS